MKERQRWQPEEDSLLRAYVKQHGPKEWNLIAQRMGRPLERDPKSCLERWKNYLKPGIKKGSLTPDEQTLVISLQSKYGNKWKKIASEVPGRTAKRLGKWWEVFREKQLKQRTRSLNRPVFSDPPSVSASGSPERPVQGKYDHILDTFAEKYVQAQPKLFSIPLPAPMPPAPEPAPPVLSLGSSNASPSPALPPWMGGTSSASSSPSVSLTLSPSEPAVLDPVQPEMSRFLPVQQMGGLIQCCREVEEGRQSWLQHKKEATWRLSRLEQQLESEKSRKRREKMEEIESKIRRLREEEMRSLDRIESEYREQLCALQREAETKEAKFMESWSGKHVKLANLVEQIGLQTHHHVFTNVLPK